MATWRRGDVLYLECTGVIIGTSYLCSILEIEESYFKSCSLGFISSVECLHVYVLDRRSSRSSQRSPKSYCVYVMSEPSETPRFSFSFAKTRTLTARTPGRPPARHATSHTCSVQQPNLFTVSDKQTVHTNPLLTESPSAFKNDPPPTTLSCILSSHVSLVPCPGSR